MRVIRLVLVLALIIPSVSALLEVDVVISDAYVLESFTYYGEPGILSFDLPSRPVSVSADHPYAVSDRIFVIEANESPVVFSFLFDDLVIASGSQRVFRSSFVSESVLLSVTLPRGATLDDAVPRAQITTDGSRMTLSWPQAPEVSVAVFYSMPAAVSWVLVGAFALPIILAFVGFAVYRSRERTVRELVSADERDVLDLIDGVRTQKEIANELSFSKSKMSKVVRKLEEKGLVRKEPHFKTNRLVRR